MDCLAYYNVDVQATSLLKTTECVQVTPKIGRDPTNNMTAILQNPVNVVFTAKIMTPNSMNYKQYDS